MPNIYISVRDKIARTVSDTYIICGNSDYVAVFDFDAEWAEHDTKTARFIWNGKHADVVFTGNQCDIPPITNAFGVEVGVFAGNLITTTSAVIDTKKSILCKNGLPADPPPEVYAQIMEMLNNGGANGQDGTTPHIGENGNWYIGDTDTGVQAQGAAGNNYVLTDADKQEIAKMVPDGESEVVVIEAKTTDGVVNLLDGWTYETILAEINAGKIAVLRRGDYTLYHTRTDDVGGLWFDYVDTDKLMRTQIAPDGTIEAITKEMPTTKYIHYNGEKSPVTYDNIEKYRAAGRRVVLRISYTNGSVREYEYCGKTVQGEHLFTYVADGNIYKAVVDTESNCSLTYYALVSQLRTINGKSLHANIVLTANDVGAISSEVTEEDEGKVLRVVNGVPTWVLLSAWEGGSY